MRLLSKMICASVLGFTAMQSFAAPPSHHYAPPHAKHMPPPQSTHKAPHWQQSKPSHVTRAGSAFPKHLQHKRFEVNYKKHGLPKPARFEQWYKVNDRYVLVNTRSDRVVRSWHG